ncbi:MAG: pilus assembly PilX N-terminal domain-containing protein [Calditrichia bacterium]
MCGINWKNQNGGALLISVFFLLILGMLVLSLVTLTVSDSSIGALSGSERQAFYAAQSGLEYGMKAVLQQDTEETGNWSETIDTGDNTTCEVSAFFYEDSLRLLAQGHSSKFVKRLERKFSYIDVSDYAVYSADKVENVITLPDSFSAPTSSLIMSNAPVMPHFDIDYLRTLSKPNRYYTKHYTLSSVFSFGASRLAFFEKDLTFDSWNLNMDGYFVSMGKMHHKTKDWYNLKIFFNTVYYLPEAKKEFKKTGQGIFVTTGGIISEGRVSGGPKISECVWVIHNRKIIRDFMQYSINGGPLLMRSHRWQNLN